MIRPSTYIYKFVSPNLKKKPIKKHPVADDDDDYGGGGHGGGGGGSNCEIQYEKSFRGNKLLHFDGHKYIRNNVYLQNVYWKCTKWHNGCRARAITSTADNTICSIKNVHTHSPF